MKATSFLKEIGRERRAGGLPFVLRCYGCKMKSLVTGKREIKNSFIRNVERKSQEIQDRNSLPVFWQNFHFELFVLHFYVEYTI